MSIEQNMLDACDHNVYRQLCCICSPEKVAEMKTCRHARTVCAICDPVSSPQYTPTVRTDNDRLYYLEGFREGVLEMMKIMGEKK